MTNPLVAIKSAPIGSATYARGEFDENMVKETMFLIREEPRVVQRLGENPQVILRAGQIEQDNVLLVAVLLRIGGAYYETWWNYHQTSGGAQYFEDMATQERIALVFFTPERTRQIAIRNSLAPFFASVGRAAAALPAWTMRDFDAARDKIYARFPTVTKLWNHLERI